MGPTTVWWRSAVETVDERVAFLEGTVREQSQMVNGIREAVLALENRVDRRFEQVDKRFERLEDRMDRRFEEMTHRFDAMDAKMSRHFVWIMGLLVTTLIAMVGSLGGIIATTMNR
jgi:uncharacterized coiled-coil protein SlyX